jgi:hypothetical protein
MGNSRRLQKHRQRGMNRRMRGNKRSMSKEQKEARKKEKEIQVAACRAGQVKAKKAKKNIVEKKG